MKEGVELYLRHSIHYMNLNQRLNVNRDNEVVRLSDDGNILSDDDSDVGLSDVDDDNSDVGLLTLTTIQMLDFSSIKKLELMSMLDETILFEHTPTP